MKVYLVSAVLACVLASGARGQTVKEQNVDQNEIRIWRSDSQPAAQAVEEIHQGDVVWIPPGQKHWHGAAPNSSMAHIALVEQLEGKVVDWMEKVSDAQYGAQPHDQGASTESGAKHRPSQGAIPDFAPKLAECNKCHQRCQRRIR